jgi:transcriptional/translational regulatory protein YebC/TACO1
LQLAHIPTSQLSNPHAVYGPDPKFNPRLSLAISNAKKAGLPKVSIESSIARGQGISSSGAALETVTIEAILPPSVATLIECQTDQKARVLQDVRYIIREMGGTITPTSYLFERKGKIVFEKVEGQNMDDYLDQAIEAGALDIAEDEEGRLTVYTEYTDTKAASEKLAELTGLKIESCEVIWDPNKDTMVKVEDEEAAKSLDDLLAAIREDSSVQEIYINAI